MKILWDLVQGTDEWKAARKGRATASRFSDIITAAKGDLSKSATGYIRELIGECYCPDWEEWEGNKYTDRGKQMEPEAREAFISNFPALQVVEVGFCLADNELCGCSPDALILGPDRKPIAGAEIKCPSPKTHIGYIFDGGLPNDYKQQVHGCMAVTGLNEWHFWSYFPGLKPHHVIVHRDDYTAKVEAALKQFVVDYKAAMHVARVKVALPEWAKEAA